MAKITTKYFQECDFCHKEVETYSQGLCVISLPGYLIESDGTKRNSLVSGTICPQCMERLRGLLGKFIKLEEADYGGNVFSWIGGEK